MNYSQGSNGKGGRDKMSVSERFKSGMTDQDRDLFKRRFYMIFMIALFSVFILLFLAAIATPASAVVQYTLEGWTLSPHPKWSTGHIAGWAQGDCVPFHYLVNNKGANAETQNIMLSFDYKAANGILGIIHYENFNIPAGNIEGPFYESPLPAEGFYWWNFTIPGSTQYDLTWCSRLSHECVLWPGASMHVKASGGNRDVSIDTPDIMPDLYATKSATVICGAINYTITYGNEGGQNQTNTVLVDDYDETKVTVTNAGGGTDSGTNITWNIGTVNISENGSVSYTVSLKPGVASGTAIINNGNISGYFAELDTADNSYTVTSSAKVNPSCDITAPDAVCALSGGNSASTNAGYANYSWALSAGTITAGQYTNAITWTAPSSTASPVNISVTVIDSNGCTNTCYKDVNANEGPTADFSAVPLSCCAPLTVQFTDLSTAGDNPITS